MRVAVLMVDFNEGRFLSRSLAALREQTRRPDRILLADNGSTDGSPEMVEREFPEVEVIRLRRNAGFAGANNAAARAAAGCDVIALLNADAFPEPNWLAALVAAAEARPDVAAFASRMLTAHDPEVLDGAGDDFHVSGLVWRRGQGQRAVAVPEAERPGEVFSACGGAAMYRRDVFLGAGGFDETFHGYYEDTDLAFRLRLLGHRVHYVPDAVVHHVGSGTAGVLSEYSIYHSHRNMVWTWARDMPWPLAALYLPWHLLVNVLSVASFAAQGHARTILRAKRDALLGLPRILRERRSVQSGRRVGWRELRRTMSTGGEVSTAMPSLGRVGQAFRRGGRS
jgi:GT2 family glycosyltransferase